MYCIGQGKKLCQYRRRAAMTLTLEDRIRELCSQAVAADDAQELNRILGELKLALHEHTERLRALLSLYPILPADLVKTDL
jgi:ATP/maltotriose-dependent transcriptional regulator MalT